MNGTSSSSNGHGGGSKSSLHAHGKKKKKAHVVAHSSQHNGVKRRNSFSDDTTSSTKAQPFKKREQRPSNSGNNDRQRRHHESPSAASSSVHAELQQTRQKLPIYVHRAKILAAVESHQVVILVGETGSGKTTQIPQYILEQHRNARIAVTQPRRVAAITVAQRVCAEANRGALGGTVGYSVRFDDTTSKATQLKFMTDGMLVREALLSPTLARYSVIVLDEAHERTLQTDILFGIVKRALRSRSDLKVVVMSATLDVALFASFFASTKPAIVQIPGRQFHVDVLYTATTQPDYLDAALVTILQLHIDYSGSDNGSILVFLTGQEDIETLETLLDEYSRTLPPAALKLLVCPIFAAMPREQQMQVFAPAPSGVRKVILATNIAETSITINGIRYVVDTGLVKQRSFVAASGMEMLLTEPVSKAQAWQRTGRAGREAPGVCYRLFPEDTFEQLAERAIPDIQRVSLEVVVLQLKTMGIDDILGFDFIEQPQTASLVKAMEKLYALGAFDAAGKLTERGRQMAGLPVEPMFAVMLLQAAALGCAEDALSVVAMLSVESIFYSPRDKKAQAAASRVKFQAFEGDHITLLNIYLAYSQSSAKNRVKWCRDHFINNRAMQRVESVRLQLRGYLERLGLPLTSSFPNIDPLRKSIVAGFFLNTAMRSLGDGGSGSGGAKTAYRTMCGRSEVVKVHPSSSLFMRNPPPQWVVFNELVFTSKHYIRSVVIIEKEWLVEIAPTFFKQLTTSGSAM